MSRRGSLPAAITGGFSFLSVALPLLFAIRPGVLLDPERGWAPLRMLLGIGWAAAAVAGAVAGAAAGWLAIRSDCVRRRLRPLPFSGRALAAIAGAALLLGTALRFAGLSELPPAFWLDGISMMDAIFALRLAPSDFADAIRPVPGGVAQPYGSVGVLYLAAERLVMEATGGPSPASSRCLAAAASAASLATGALLGRALLPSGGGALTALLLAGLRGHLIQARWGWNAIVLIPLADLALLAMIKARAGGRRSMALAAGLLAGVGAHVYLSAWVVFAGLLLLAIWPRDSPPRRPRAGAAALLCLGFAIAVAPLFLLREGRRFGYFERLQTASLRREVELAGSPMPALEAVDLTIRSPWLPDPSPLNDVPGRSRLGVFLGALLVLGLLRALARPRNDASAALLAIFLTAGLASVTGGRAMAPNGNRFAYLFSPLAVAAVSGALGLVAALPESRRRVAAIAVTGGIAITAALGARDGILRWSESPTTFTYLRGEDTLMGRAAGRWDEFGAVSLEDVATDRVTLDAVRRYRLDPGRPASPSHTPASGRLFRLVRPDAEAEPGERTVERIRDGQGRPVALVLGRRGPPAPSPAGPP